jgi:starvation-inducible DNA-binding protein
MRQAHNACSEHKDVATVSLIENYIDQVEKRVWFLYESQQGQGANRVI